jgi:hypothetical protein
MLFIGLAHFVFDPGDETWEMKVKVLREDVEHHVKEEEGEMFPDARKFLGKTAGRGWRRTSCAQIGARGQFPIQALTPSTWDLRIAE